MRMDFDVPTYPTENTYIEGTLAYSSYININVPTYPLKKRTHIKLCYVPCQKNGVLLKKRKNPLKRLDSRILAE